MTAPCQPATIREARNDSRRTQGKEVTCEWLHKANRNSHVDNQSGFMTGTKKGSRDMTGFITIEQRLIDIKGAEEKRNFPPEPYTVDGSRMATTLLQWIPTR